MTTTAKSSCRALAVAAFTSILAAVAIPAPANAQSDGIAELLAKHRAFVGWTAGDGSITSLRSSATVTEPLRKSDPPGTAPKTWTLGEVRRGLRYRDSGGGPGFGSLAENGFNGRAFWEADENDYVVDLLEDEARLRFSLDAFFSDAISTLPGTLRRSGKIGDASVDIVRVAPGIGFPIDVYEDASGAYLRAVIAPDNQNARTTIEIDRYLEAAPGKKILGAYHSPSGERLEVTKVELNVAIADADLNAPPPTSVWTFASTDPVPIEFEHGSDSSSRQVNVLATIDGHEGRFLLDSGASGILLFRHFASLLNLESIGTTSYSGVNGGIVRADLARVKDISVGKNVLHNVVITKSSRDGDGIDGLLGYDFLAGAIVDVDLIRGEMTILDPAHFAPVVPKGAYAFPIDLSTRQPAVHVTLRGKVDARPIVDTGNAFLVLLSSALSTGETLDTREIFVGVDGTSESSVPCSRLNQLLVGPYRYEDSLVCFADPNVFGDNGGLIGFDFLRHFNWTFDYPDAKLVLRPNGI